MTKKEQIEAAAAAGHSLEKAYLSGAWLGGANLRGTNLSGAYLSEADLWGAKWDDSTVWPVGFRPPKPSKRRSRKPKRTSRGVR